MATMAIPISKNLDAEMTDFLSIISENTSFMNKNQAKQLGEIKNQRRKDENLNKAMTNFEKKYIDQAKQGEITWNKYLEIMSNYKKIFMELQKQGEDEKNRQNKMETLKFKSEMSSGFMKNYYARQLEYMEIDEKFNERNAQILEMQQAGRLSPTEARQMQFKNKMNKMYDKWLIKGNFFKNVITNLKDIAKGVWDAAEGWIIKLLKFLFIMAIFDPDGKFLSSIMDMITKAVVWLINKLAEYLPRIVKSFIKLIVNILPPLLIKMVQAISPAIGNLIDSFLGKNSTIGRMFKEGGLLYNLFSFLAEKIPIILGLFLAVKAINFLSPLIDMVKILGTFGFALIKNVALMVIWIVEMVMWAVTLYGGVIPALIAGMFALWAFMAPILAVVLPILLVVAAIVLLIIYAEELYDFFDAIPQWLEEKLGSVGKILGGIFEVLGAPLKSLFWFVKSIKKFGLANTFAIIWNNIKNLGKYLMEALTNAFWSAINAIKNIGANAWKSVKDFGGNAATRVMNALGSFADWLSDIFLKSLKKIGSWFEMVSISPAVAFGLKGNEAYAKLMNVMMAKRYIQDAAANDPAFREKYKNDTGFIGKVIQGKEIKESDYEKESLGYFERFAVAMEKAAKGESYVVPQANMKVEPAKN